MILSTKTTIGFSVPDECEAARVFLADHPDFQVSETSSVIWCTKSEIYQNNFYLTKDSVTIFKEDE